MKFLHCKVVPLYTEKTNKGKMKKTILFTLAILLVSSTFIGANIVTSTLQGSRLIFIAQEGSTVKKGEPLVKYGTSSTMDKIAGAKANLQSAEADLKDKTGDLKRYKILKEGSSATAEKVEKTEIAYYKAIFSAEKCKSTIKALEAKLSMAVIPAPFDCKITKVIISENSGTDYGQEIMEIEPISDSKALQGATETTAENSSRTVTSTMYGCVVSYLAPEGEIVKKGELLVKLVNPITEAEVEGLKRESKYAEQALESARMNLERYSKLKGKSISLAYFEEMEIFFEEAKYAFDWNKKNVQFYEGYNASGAIYAPFDCKVTKVFMILNAGSEAGTPIMEITPISIPTSEKLNN